MHGQQNIKIWILLVAVLCNCVQEVHYMVRILAELLALLSRYSSCPSSLSSNRDRTNDLPIIMTSYFSYHYGNNSTVI